MPELAITVLDPDTSLVDRAARQLRTHLKEEGVLATVLESSCYLEISRQGLKGRTPVISVNGRHYQCRDLEDSLLRQFAHWLAQNRSNEASSTQDSPQPSGSADK